jgi:hypothetical protein
MGRGGDSLMAFDAGNPSMDRLSIFFLIKIERDGSPIDLLLDILFPMTIHTEEDGSSHPLVTVQIGLTMAPPT